MTEVIISQNGKGHSFYIHHCAHKDNPFVPMDRTGERVPLLVVLEEPGDSCPHCGFVCPEEEK